MRLSRRLLLFWLLMAGILVVGLPHSEAFAVEIIAHRGASHDAPENTLASVNLAWKRNADAVEIDVFLTKDGKIVATHDKTPKRFGGPDRKISEQTLAELKTIDVGKWKDPKWAGERMPTLSEVLKTVPEGKRLFIEIKCGPEILPELKRVLKAAGTKPAQTVVIGFSYATMKAAKRQLPRLKVYWVVKLKQDKQTKAWRPGVATLIRKAKAAKLDGLDLGDSPVLNRADVNRVHAAGLRLFVWTVNSVEAARRLKAAGVDGITTDRPGWLKTRLSSKP